MVLSKSTSIPDDTYHWPVFRLLRFFPLSFQSRINALFLTVYIMLEPLMENLRVGFCQMFGRPQYLCEYIWFSITPFELYRMRMGTSLDLECVLFWLQDHDNDLGILSRTRRHDLETHLRLILHLASAQWSCSPCSLLSYADRQL